MAISRVPGAALLSDLDRQGIDLEFTTLGNTLVYMDFANFYVGINEANPSEPLTVNGNILVGDGHIITNDNLTYSIGSVTNQWNTVWANSVSGTLLTNAQPNITSVGTLTNLTVEGDFVAGNINIANLVINGDSIIDAGNNQIINVADPLTSTDAATKAYVDAQISGTAFGNLVALGIPSDGNIAFPGAYDGWTPATTITQAVDDLNEMMNNVRNNTFVKSVTFTGSPTSGGEGTTVTLSLTVDGNANRYDIDWGDGETPTNGTTDSTPSHTYSNNALSPFTVTVTAYNNGGSGTGSSADSTRTDYIIIYTANPVAAFGLYRASSGGSALSGSNLYVTEGETFYLENTTTNTTMADVTYKVNYGDGSGNVSVADDSADGGVLGARLAYTYGYSDSSGTGTLPVTLYLDSHTTANPAVIPTSASLNLKVYDANISAPNGLSTKTISFTGSTGNSPYLASGFTDNTSGTSLSAGQSVSRTVATGTTAVQTATLTTYAYDADSGILSAIVNGAYSGNITLTSGSDVGLTGNVQLVAESDYNLLNASGSSVSFSNSIYAPGLFTGFTARVSRTGGSISPGVNSYRLLHSTTGGTNTVEFVKDDLTASPTVTVGTLEELSGGTKRYVSGIPYYNSGSPTLRISGAEISNFVGQTYRNTSSPVQVTSGTNSEGTSSSAISTQSYTYSQIDGAVSMLSGGIPIVDTGVGSAYAIGNLTVSITSSSVRTVETLGMLAYNVNGTSSTVQTTNKVQVHTSSQSGISEIAIAVSDSLGNGVYTDDGVRIFDFSADTTNTPSYSGATNFYTNDPYTESSDPGVEGTKEATIRLGVLKHDVTDYSSGFLPVGPDRSSDTGTQYFTFAFRRQVVGNFDLNITSSTGVSGVWIAAPGTAIDSASTLNGWLDTSTTYGGSGVPGADTGNGGNGSNGCAFTSGDRIQTGVSLSGGYTMTLGSENMTNATGNVVLVRIALQSGESVTALSVGVAS